MSYQSRHFKRGFTLTELLIAISIIAIMSTTTIVGINDFLPYWRLSGGTKQLMGSISETQGYSVSEQAIHKITLTVNSGNYQIIKESDSGDQVVKSIDLPPTVKVSSLSANITNDVIKFNFFGAPLDSLNQPLGAAQITLTNNRDRTMTVEVTPAGNVKAY